MLCYLTMFYFYAGPFIYHLIFCTLADSSLLVLVCLVDSVVGYQSYYVTYNKVLRQVGVPVGVVRGHLTSIDLHTDV